MYPFKLQEEAPQYHFLCLQRSWQPGIIREKYNQAASVVLIQAKYGPVQEKERICPDALSPLLLCITCSFSRSFHHRCKYHVSTIIRFCSVNQQFSPVTASLFFFYCWLQGKLKTGVYHVVVKNGITIKSSPY